MICFKINTILDNEEEINQFLECCGGKFSKACPTQPPSMCHNMTMGMPVSHLIRGWLPDVASTGSASRLNVSTRDFRVDFTPVLSLLCSPAVAVSCHLPSSEKLSAFHFPPCGPIYTRFSGIKVLHVPARKRDRALIANPKSYRNVSNIHNNLNKMTQSSIVKYTPGQCEHSARWIDWIAVPALSVQHRSSNLNAVQR